MPLPKIFSYDQVEEAIKKSGGYITTAAEQLNCSVTTVRKYLKESKQLRELLFETRERWLDIAETELTALIQEPWAKTRDTKSKVAAILFYLKCQGKDRGWIDRADWVKPGVSQDKPLFIRIMPIGGMTENTGEKRKPGRPFKTYREVKIQPEKQMPMITGMKEGDIIDIEPEARVSEKMMRDEEL
jgi:hypothetical protein